MPARTSPGPAQRADARRSIERILDAAVEELAHDQASMATVAARAGVARATLYAHFPTREALIAAVTERAIAEAVDTIRSADPDRGEPSEALARMIAAAWRALGRYHGLVAINTRLDRPRQHKLHQPVLTLIRPVLERGRASGDFNADVPTDWLLAVVLELVHAASAELRAGRLDAGEAESALTSAVLGAVSPPRARAS